MSTDKQKRYLEFDGEFFTQEPKSGYWQNTRTRERLHRFVWRHYFGDIPKGFHIHHIDGDKSNNDISNLALLSPQAHLKLHAEARSPETLQRIRDNCDRIRPLTKAWHASKAGFEWHKAHYEQMKDKLHKPREYTCLNCGKTFISTKVGSKFCCNNCKSKNRRKMGFDNITRVCAFCGKEFVCNKYSKRRFCSISCGNAARNKTK